MGNVENPQFRSNAAELPVLYGATTHAGAIPAACSTSSEKMNIAILRVREAMSTSSSCVPRPSAGVACARRWIDGFTLIEVLIAVAVISILTAVALPNYTAYVTRSKIIEATSGLSDIRVRLEQYYLDSRQYPATCVASASGPAPAGQIYLPASSKYFSFTCALTTSTYTVTATGKSATGMGSFIYTVDQGNTKKTTGLPSGWAGAGAGSTCWVIRQSGDC